ncbi:MAG: cytochrome c [Myxococcales bacterium]|nr:cytochrome c [Myxococcales bacterium]
MRWTIGWATVGLLAMAAAGCGGSGEQDPIARGRASYLGNCVACHNPNPKLAGAIGPALAGSSRELLEAKVLRNEYPPGYEPKRPTQVMVPLPHLEPEIDDLAAYLGSIPEASIP